MNHKQKINLHTDTYKRNYANNIKAQKRTFMEIISFQ